MEMEKLVLMNNHILCSAGICTFAAFQTNTIIYGSFS